MTIEYKGKNLEFVYRGFGPLYTFEAIAKRTFNPQLVSDMHLLIYSTMLFCNPGSFKDTPLDFFQFLYDNPEEEAKLVNEIANAWKQRASLVEEKQKKSE